jgi:hypothetical protein
MRNLIIALCLTIFSSATIYAQSTNYTAFEWDVINIGVAAPLNNDSLKGGISFGGEIRYNALNNLSIGVGGEMVIFKSKDFSETETGTVESNFYFGISSDYYFSSDSRIRPFVGLGIGVSVNGDIEGVKENEETEFYEGLSGAVIVPRLGIELDHVRIMTDINIGLEEGLNDYFGVKVGFTLGGGYKGSN